MEKRQKMISVSSNYKLTTTHGYSLIEVLIAIGILGIAMLASTGVLNQSASSMGRINALADATSQIAILKSALEDPVVCRLNFGGKKAPIQNTLVKYKINNTTLGLPIIPLQTTAPQTLNSNEAVAIGNTLISGMILGNSGNQILHFKGFFITKIEGSVQIKSVLDFPIFAKIDSTSGDIQECSSKSFFYGGSDFNEKICKLASTSSQELTFDTTTNTCVDANEIRCTAGGPTTASCEPNAIGLVKTVWESCKVQNYAGENITYTRSFGGVKTDLPMVPYLCVGNEKAKSVKCTLADDLNSAEKTVCMACCIYKRKI